MSHEWCSSLEVCCQAHSKIEKKRKVALSKQEGVSSSSVFGTETDANLEVVKRVKESHRIEPVDF